MLIVVGCSACSLAACQPASTIDIGNGPDDSEKGPGPRSCDGEWERFDTHPVGSADFEQASGGPGVYFGLASQALAMRTPDGWEAHELDDLFDGSLGFVESADSVYYVNFGNLAHWNGKKVETTIIDGVGLSAVAGSPGRAPWVVGIETVQMDHDEVPYLAELVDGELVRHEPPPEVFMHDIWVGGSGEVVVVGAAGRTAIYDGVSWTTAAFGDKDLWAVVGSEQAVFAYGQDGVARWTGGAWEALPPPGHNSIDQLVARGDELWAWNRATPPWLGRFDGTSWKWAQPAEHVAGLAVVDDDIVVTARTASTLQTFVAHDVDDLELVDEAPWLTDVEHFAGARLDELVARGTAKGQGLARFSDAGWQWWLEDLAPVATDVHIDDEGRVWMSGGLGGEGLWSVEQGALQAWPLPSGTSGVTDLWVRDEDEIWIVAAEQTYRFDGTAWEHVPTPKNPHEVIGLGERRYLEGEFGVYELLDGQWIALRKAEEMRDIAVLGPDALVSIEKVPGANVSATWDGDRWSERTWPVKVRLCQVDGLGSDDVWISGFFEDDDLGTLGRLWHYDGEDWHEFETPAGHCADVYALEDAIVLEERGNTFVMRCSRD